MNNSWKGKLIDKTTELKEKSENGKHYLRCPHCNTTEYMERIFDTEMGTVKHIVRPSMSHGTYIYIPKINSYGVCFTCFNCFTLYYGILNSYNDSFELITRRNAFKGNLNNDMMLAPFNIYLAKVPIDINTDSYVFINNMILDIITKPSRYRNNGKFKPFDEIKKLYLEELEESYNE